MLFEFLWGSGKEKVKRRTTVRDMGDGGLQMTDIEFQINALWCNDVYTVFDVNMPPFYKDVIKVLHAPEFNLFYYIKND